MKAVTILSPRVMEMVDVPEPTPGHGEVLLRVERIGYCGTDLNTYRGTNPLVSYPRIPGHEIQARIVAFATGVETRLEIGQSVTVMPYTHCGQCPSCSAGRFNACRFNQTLGVQRDGALCEYLTVPAEKLFAHPGLTDGALALVEPLAVGMHAAERGCVRENDTVMVIGCGMIGLGAVAAAADLGARVIGVDIDDSKLDLARLAGAAETINSSTQSIDSRLSELTAGDGPDVAIEAVGHPQTFVACVEHVAFAGRVVYIGYAKEPVVFQTKSIILKELDILGSRNATRADFDRVIRMLNKGKYPIGATITQTVPLDAAADAMAEWDENPRAITRIHVELK